MDLYSHLVPVYDVEPLEKITDAYLDQYLCTRLTSGVCSLPGSNPPTLSHHRSSPTSGAKVRHPSAKPCCFRQRRLFGYEPKL